MTTRRVREFARFDEQVLTLETPETFVTEAPPPAQMTYGQLRTYVRDLGAAGYDVREDRSRSTARSRSRSSPS